VSNLALAATLIPITVALDWTPNTNHIGLYVAQAKGLFTKQGLNVRMVQMRQTSTTQLVAVEKAQFGISFLSDVLHARAQKIPVVSIAGMLPENTSCFAWRASTPIENVKGFEGKRYGGWGSPEEEATLRYVMKNSNADFSKLKMVTTGISDFLPSTIKNADFMWIFMGWDGVRAQLEKVAIKTICLRDIDPVFNHPSPLLITSEGYIKENKLLIKKFLAATAEGYQFAAKSPLEAANLFSQLVPETDKKLVEASARTLAPEYVKKVPYWGYQELAKFNAYAKWANEQRILDLKEDATQFANNSFLPSVPLGTRP